MFLETSTWGLAPLLQYNFFNYVSLFKMKLNYYYYIYMLLILTVTCSEISHILGISFFVFKGNILYTERNIIVINNIYYYHISLNIFNNVLSEYFVN